MSLWSGFVVLGSAAAAALGLLAGAPTGGDIQELDAEYDELAARLVRSREALTTAQQRLREIRLQETQHFSPYLGRYSGTPQEVNIQPVCVSVLCDGMA